MNGIASRFVDVHRLRLHCLQAGRSTPPPPIATPTRVLWGARDPVLKVSWTDRLPELFIDLQLGVAADAGHFVHLESPDLAAEAIAAFFDGLAQRPQSGA